MHEILPSRVVYDLLWRIARSSIGFFANSVAHSTFVLSRSSSLFSPVVGSSLVTYITNYIFLALLE